jgi:glutamyl-tRNA synthetase
MVRTRFAPSPTGSLHIGGLRTALYSYALAKRNKGQFILRIEDTDKKREVKGSLDEIIELLHLFHLNYDEGPDIGGSYGPYVQSQRLDIYRKKSEELVEKGFAYYCFCSPERLEDLRKDQLRAKLQPKYDGKCRELDISESRKRISKGEKYVIRLKVPEKRKIEFTDAIRGKVSWDSKEVDDQVLLKSDGFPTYHLGVVVDDVMMGITHITRGIEWMPSVPKHILLFEAFGYKIPIMAHMPVILDPAGGKLSKRKGTVATKEFLRQGYLPETILNFIMLLGWAPKDDREFFTLVEFVQQFELKDLNNASPVFDRQKLLWFNGMYIRKLSLENFTKRVVEWAKLYCTDQAMKNYMLKDSELSKKLALIQERLQTLDQIPVSLTFFYTSLPMPDPSAVKGIKRYKESEIKSVLKEYIEIFESYDENSGKWKHENWEKDIRSLGDKYSWKHADIFMLIRLAVCGSPVSPPLFESLVILGKDEVESRLKKALV